MKLFWPTTFTRYVSWELAKVFFTTLSIFTLFLIFVGVGQEGVRNGLTPSIMLRLVPFLLPNALCFAIPGTALFSACSVYGAMSANNEIVALKSMGIHPFAVVKPAIIFSLIVSVACVWLIDVAFSWGYLGAQRVIATSVQEIAYSVLERKKNFTWDELTVHVAGVQGDQLILPTIVVQGKNGRKPVTITAQYAKIGISKNQEYLNIALTNGTVKLGNESTLRFPNTIEQPIALGDADEPGSGADNPSHMRMIDIPNATIRQQGTLKEVAQTAAAESAYRLISGDYSNQATPEEKDGEKRLTLARNRYYRLRTEPYRRWASGFSSLCFVIAGIPLAVRMKNSDYMSTFGACFIPILLIYYPLFAFGLSRAKHGVLPPGFVWLGNAACVLVGMWLFRKVIRH